MTDYIAYRYAIAEEQVRLTIVRQGEARTVVIVKDLDEDLGLTFAADVFDGVRSCGNNCVFCFEAQMPSGMRSALRLPTPGNFTSASTNFSIVWVYIAIYPSLITLPPNISNADFISGCSLLSSLCCRTSESTKCTRTAALNKSAITFSIMDLFSFASSDSLCKE